MKNSELLTWITVILVWGLGLPAMGLLIYLGYQAAVAHNKLELAGCILVAIVGASVYERAARAIS